MTKYHFKKSCLFTHYRLLKQALYSLSFLIILCCEFNLFSNPRKGIKGKKAPEFPDLFWIDATNKVTKDIKLKNYRGKMIYLTLFQSWCPGCLNRSLPLLKKLSEKYQDRNRIVFLAVQTVFEGFAFNHKDQIYYIKDKFKLNFPIGHDDGSSLKRNKSILMNLYKSKGTPWTVIIDHNGTVIYNNFHITEKSAINIINSYLEKSTNLDIKNNKKKPVKKHKN